MAMAINLWELWSGLSWMNAASSTDGITQSSVNYLNITYLNEWKHFGRQFLLLLWPL